MTTEKHGEKPSRRATCELWLLAGQSIFLFACQMFTARDAGFGIFIDELYYIACAKHLAFGYIDHPPLSIALLALNRTLLGDSIPALRFLPALAGAGTVFMTGLLARRLGGSTAAMVLAATGAIAMPTYLIMSSFYSMNAFEPLIWAVILYFVIRMIQENQPRYWLIIGLLAGIGLEMKHTIVIYFFALGIGMLVTPARRFLWHQWIIAGALLAALLFMPNMIWQYLHGFPSLDFYREAMIQKNIQTGPLQIVLGQILLANPLALPLWVAGLIFFLFSVRMRNYRFVAWTYIVLLGLMIISRSSRPDRIASIYTILFAGGANAIASIRPRPLRHWAMAAAAGFIVAGGVIGAPIFTPILPPQQTTAYLSAIGFSFSIEKGKAHEQLPQWLGDRLGWRELAEDVARVYQSLPEREKPSTVIVSGSYGIAGALDLYGPEFGSPRVFCTHNNYHLWGPPSDSANPYIGVGVGRKDWENKFDSVIEAGVHTCLLASGSRKKIPIYVAHGPKFSVAADWPKFKAYH